MPRPFERLESGPGIVPRRARAGGPAGRSRLASPRGRASARRSPETVGDVERFEHASRRAITLWSVSQHALDHELGDGPGSGLPPWRRLKNWLTNGLSLGSGNRSRTRRRSSRRWWSGTAPRPRGRSRRRGLAGARRPAPARRPRRTRRQTRPGLQAEPTDQVGEVVRMLASQRTRGKPPPIRESRSPRYPQRCTSKCRDNRSARGDGAANRPPVLAPGRSVFLVPPSTRPPTHRRSGPAAAAPCPGQLPMSSRDATHCSAHDVSSVADLRRPLLDSECQRRGRLALQPPSHNLASRGSGWRLPQRARTMPTATPGLFNSVGVRQHEARETRWAPCPVSKSRRRNTRILSVHE